MTEQPKKQNHIRALLFVHIAIIAISLAVLLFSQALKLRDEDIFNLWRFISVITFVWIIWSWYKTKHSIFNPYGLFLLAVFFFNLSPVVLSLIPGNNQISLTNLFPLDIAAQTVIVVNLCLLGLHLGALCATNSVSIQKPKTGWDFSDKDLIFIGYLLILISLYPLYLTTQSSIQLSVSLGYNSLYRQSIGTGLLAGPTILADFMIPGVLFLLAGSKKNKLNLILSIVIIICYTIAQLILGRRSVAIMPLIAYLWLWHKIIKPIRIGLIAILSSVFLFFIFPVIRLSRNFTGLERLSLKNISDLFSTTNPFLDVFNEMGSTMQTISHTIQIIPTYRHFDFGVSYLYSLTTILPNLFWQTHPVIAHGTFGSWLISIVDPAIARLGGSIGYSFIAEAYANFGSYGAMAIVALIGYLFVLFSEVVEKSNSKALLSSLATYLSFFLFFARSESSTIIRPFIWYALIPLALLLFIKKYKSKNA